MPDILHLIKIHAPIERVYQAITTAEGIRNWWTREADLDESIGGRGEFRFSAYGTNQHATRVSIEELISPTHVEWKTISSFRPEWSETSISFDLRPEGSTTVLLFAHRDFAQADEIYALTTTGWAYYLVSLQQYLESGQGAPSPDIDFARMIR
ncbi:SRPBCC family protein [Acidicapsa acidisoli]|uniref:SRPBCC family protein n=1 Tax=Acidicapsa acidisoli TaxID=1615681 RepID=UPI0021E0B5C3|nr:SRPBCC domain-containing protein [Acidicapsa acidisoli]